MKDNKSDNKEKNNLDREELRARLRKLGDEELKRSEEALIKRVKFWYG